MAQGGEASVIGRRQWVGMDGAPTVFWGSGHVGFAATAGLNIRRHESLAVEKLTEASAFFAKSVRTRWIRPSGRTCGKRTHL